MKNKSLTSDMKNANDNTTEADELILAIYEKTIIDALKQIESVKRKLQNLIKKK